MFDNFGEVKSVPSIAVFNFFIKGISSFAVCDNPFSYLSLNNVQSRYISYGSALEIFSIILFSVI